MAKVVLDKREANIFKFGKAIVPNEKAKYSIIPGNSENANDLDSYQQLIIDTVNLLDGHLGGHGIDLVDEEGNSLSEQCQYDDPTLDYRGINSVGSK